jgi:flagellin-like protein
MKAIIRKDEQAVSPVIATILMVAITVVLAAVLYVMVSGLISGPTSTKPVITFTTPAVSSQGWTFGVAGATPIVAIGSYKINLQVDGTGATTAVALAAAMSLTVSGTTYRINYTDVSGNGNLKPGDSFRIMSNTYGALASGHSWSFVLIWTSDGSAFPAVTWST